MMKIASAGLALVIVPVLAASACRAPGEPPGHPNQGAYRDVIRREIEAAGGALATGELLLRYVDRGDVPHSYARVVIRQAANDLRKVAQDLAEITPPAGMKPAQSRFRAITLREQHQLGHLYHHLDDASTRQRARAALSVDSNTLDQDLAPKLDPP